MSRPEKPIDWVRVDELLMAGCLGTEIAANFDMHPNTFYDRVTAKYGMGFTEYSSEKKCAGESILRETQYLKAIGASDKGDNTLLIWLGKQRLEQREPEAKTNTVFNTQQLEVLTAFFNKINSPPSASPASTEEKKENHTG